MTDTEHSPPQRLRRAALLVLVLLAGLGVAWWMLRPAAEPVTVDSTTDRAGAVGVTERLADAVAEGAFRVVLTGDELALLVREALAGAPVEVRDLTIDIHPAGHNTARLEASGSITATGLPARATATVTHAGQRLDVEVQDSRIAGVALPGAARRGIDDLLDGAVDVGALLGAEGVRIESLEVEDGALVLRGHAKDPDRVADQLRQAARDRAGVRSPPPERLGRGDVDERQRSGEAGVVAIGDSVAAGTGSPDHRDAFPSRLHRALGNSTERGYVNLAEPGATAQSMVDGGQVDRARDVLSTRDVEVVVVSVGGNELLALLERPPCGEDLASRACAAAIDQTAGAYADVLDAILGDVVGAAPGAQVVVLTPYNPFSTGGAGPSDDHTDAAVRTIRRAAQEAAAGHDVAVANPAPAFRGRAATLTRLRERPPDIHPTPLGHDVLAWTVLQVLEP